MLDNIDAKRNRVAGDTFIMAVYKIAKQGGTKKDVAEVLGVKSTTVEQRMIKINKLWKEEGRTYKAGPNQGKVMQLPKLGTVATAVSWDMIAQLAESLANDNETA